MNKKVKNQSEALIHKRYREGKKERLQELEACWSYLEKNEPETMKRFKEGYENHPEASTATPPVEVPATEETPTDPLLLQNVLESMVLEGVTPKDLLQDDFSWQSESMAFKDVTLDDLLQGDFSRQSDSMALEDIILDDLLQGDFSGQF
jgi:hypothetical protein